MSRIVTIGREFGSGGRELGRRLAEALGAEYYDKEIVAQIAGRTALSERYVQEVLERRPHPLFPIRVGRTLSMGADSAALQQAQAVYQEQFRVIRELAAQSDCVIVGRCAEYILREEKPFRLFVYAEPASRLARCRAKAPAGEPALTDRELRQRIAQVDQGRAQYYHFYTGQKWGDRLNYDLCLNTTGADLQKLAPALARLLG